jgi:hypothetical protein
VLNVHFCTLCTENHQLYIFVDNLRAHTMLGTVICICILLWIVWLAKWAWAKLNRTVHSTVYGEPAPGITSHWKYPGTFLNECSVWSFDGGCFFHQIASLSLDPAQQICLGLSKILVKFTCFLVKKNTFFASNWISFFSEFFLIHFGAKKVFFLSVFGCWSNWWKKFRVHCWTTCKITA